MACIGVAGDGLAIPRFPCVGWTGIGVAGEGLACGFGFVIVDAGAAPDFAAGVDRLVVGAAFIGPVAGVMTLLCDGLLLRNG